MMWKIFVFLTLVSMSTGLDTQAPNILCPTNVTSDNYVSDKFELTKVRTDVGTNYATVTWDAPVVTDDSGNVNVTSSPYESGDEIPIQASVHTITFTATDSSGNTNTCDLLISVIDDEDPACTVDPVTVSAELDESNATISFVITVFDNVQVSSIETDNGDVSIGGSGQMHVVDRASKEIDSIGTFPVGETEVVFTIVDSASPSGNDGSCVFYVTVNEFTPTTLTAPTISDGYNAGNRCIGSFNFLVGILCLYVLIIIF